MSDESGYNGWKNYETWAVALWIDNDQGTYSHSRERVREIAEEAPDDANVARAIWNIEQAARYNTADWLKEWVKDELLPDLGASLAADLLGAACDEVDWSEIAENYLSEIKENA